MIIRKKKRTSYRNLKISRELRDIIHGYIMSDGYLNEAGNLTVDQNQKQAKFVRWLYEKFEHIRTSPPIRTVERTDKRTNTVTISNRFNTRNLLHGFHSMWYKSNLNDNNIGQKIFKKKLPKSIQCFLSPVFLSVWFAGDGTKTIGSLGAKYEVTAFSPEERIKLKNLFKSKYNITTTISRSGVSTSGKEQWALCINAPEYPKFKALITENDLITRLFPYKLH